MLNDFLHPSINMSPRDSIRASICNARVVICDKPVFTPTVLFNKGASRLSFSEKKQQPVFVVVVVVVVVVVHLSANFTQKWLIIMSFKKNSLLFSIRSSLFQSAIIRHIGSLHRDL